MKLHTYLKRKKMTPTAFARKAKCSTATIYNIMEGKHRTRLDIAMRIARATNGRVSITDLLDFHSEIDEKESA